MSQDQPSAEPSHKRVPRPTMDVLRDELEVKSNALDTSLPPITGDESHLELVEMANRCQISATAYIATLRLMAARLLEVGSTEEAKQIKSLKSTTKDRVNEYIRSVNAAMDPADDEDGCSLLSRSTLASLSATSQASSQRSVIEARVQAARASAERQSKEEDLEFQGRQIERNEAMDKIAMERRKLQREQEVDALAAELSVLNYFEQNSALNVSVDQDQRADASESYPVKIVRTTFQGRVSGRDLSSSYKETGEIPVKSFATSSGPLLQKCLDSNTRQVLQPVPNTQSPDLPTLSTLNVEGKVFDPSMFLVRRELFEKSSDPFLGTGQEDKFYSWVALLKNKLQGFQLSPLDEINVLIANTSGEANRLVKDFQVAGGTDPAAALEMIWCKLKERYGSGNKVASSLRAKLDEFPSIKAGIGLAKNLRELSDLCAVIGAQVDHIPELCTFNFADGIRSIWEKLPMHFQHRWKHRCHKFRNRNRDCHPPFQVFVEFLSDAAKEASEDVEVETSKPKPVNYGGSKHQAYATSTVYPMSNELCPIHNSATHQLSRCRSFLSMTPTERHQFIRRKDRCFLCLGNHYAQSCTSSGICSTCSGRHHTLLHQESHSSSKRVTTQEELAVPKEASSSVLCVNVCENVSKARSCGKTLLVDISLVDQSIPPLRCYAILDEQSDTTFAHPQIWEHFEIDGPLESFSISTLTGHCFNQHGRVLHGLLVEGVSESVRYPLPPAFENHLIPDTRAEVATPNMVRTHSHIAHLANKFLDVDTKAEVLLLIGRDGKELMRTEVHGGQFPYAHHTALGWSVVGSICPNNQSNFNQRALRTSMDHDHFQSRIARPTKANLYSIKCETTPNRSTLSEVFHSMADDELDGPSQEDERFLLQMKEGIHQNPSGNWELPLPFKKDEPILPNNQAAVFKRTKRTLDRLLKDAPILNQCVAAMEKSIQAGHVEAITPADLLPTPGKAWWLPIFPVVHPKKGKVRLVWDSSAIYHGTSLNSELMQGPDENNKLHGVLLRFREGEIGFMADVESMFHSFHVNEEHRNFLRFYWYRQNNPTNGLAQFRAKVHIFGNKPSPAIATFALRHSASAAVNASNTVQDFINDRFYVDDGLGTADDPETCIQILQETRAVLESFNVRLHKIVSSNSLVMAAFPATEIAADLIDVDFHDAPLQRTLGVAWSISRDEFWINVDLQPKSFTRRGVLAIINSIYDPLGFVSPVVISGRLMQRNILSSHPLSSQEWDDPLPEEYSKPWKKWLESLEDLHLLAVPRGLVPEGFGKITTRTLHVFSDASKDSIGYAIYARSVNESHQIHVNLLCGNSKIAPRSANSIPRLELCGALEATLAANKATEELTIAFDSICFYCDSLVVLGYLQNTVKRFNRYVSRRILAILSMTDARQWQYVPSKVNPADIATRAQTPRSLLASEWFRGPEFLWSVSGENPSVTPTIPEILPEAEKDNSKIVLCIKDANVPILQNLTQRISSWKRLTNIVCRLLSISQLWLRKARNRLQNSPNELEIKCDPKEHVDRDYARKLLLQCAQQSCYSEVISKIQNGHPIPIHHPLAKLCPIMGPNNLLHVGGRLKRSLEPFHQKHPVLVPSSHPIHAALLQHYHQETKHQGRHLTHGAIRLAGFHLEDGRRSIRQLLSSCITCRRLRGKPETQLMADLPADRIEMVPPFTNVGLDIFGPFHTQEGKATRRRLSTTKVWALLFTCLVSRSVHLELLPSMDTSSFKNAMRRFFSIRGPCKVIRSDRGTNIIGALGQDSEYLDLDSVRDDLKIVDCEWILNPPCASHFGGSWERKIGSVRRVLEGALAQTGPRGLSRDELHTFLLESVAIVNSTPLWDVSHDPNDPVPLSPASLLTLKADSSVPLLENFNESDLLAYGKRRWRRIQFLSDQFWVRWKQFYLQNLQTRQKWTHPKRSLQPGDLVLLRNKTDKRFEWPFGLVESVRMSQDGHVRSAIIKRNKADSNGVMKKHLYERPISQLVLLAPPGSKA